MEPSSSSTPLTPTAPAAAGKLASDQAAAGKPASDQDSADKPASDQDSAGKLASGLLSAATPASPSLQGSPGDGCDQEALASPMARPVRVRFAPSPTGMLHIGGARTAIYNWAFARANGGSFILRIEDTDPERSTEENTQVILRALQWLGLDWDEGPSFAGDALAGNAPASEPTSQAACPSADKGAFGPYRQSLRTTRYTQTLETLKARGAAYPCFCSKDLLDAKRAAAEQAEGGYAGYDRSCRSLDPREAAARIAAGEPHVWRLKVPIGRPEIRFDDAVYGTVAFPAEVMDDMVLVRTDGSPTYNFAVVCDDADMQISHVIRGDDHLSNTPRQILIYEALGMEPPVFAHLSMILGPDGKKLSKRHGAASVEEYRDRGYLPDALVNFLALLGWSLDGETTLIARDELAKQFSLERVTKKDAVFDEVKLDWMNGAYIRAMGDSAWVGLARPWLLAAGAQALDLERRPEWYHKLYPLLAERLTRLDEIPDKLAYLFWGDRVALDDESVASVLLKEGCRAEEALLACREVLADTGIPWECEALQEACRALAEPRGMKAKALFQPLRVAVCGNKVSPPLFESIELLDRADVLARIDSTLHRAFGA